MSYRITNHQAISPFIQYIYTGNEPSPEAAKSYANDGFNVSALNVTTLTAGAKYSYAW